MYTMATFPSPKRQVLTGSSHDIDVIFILPPCQEGTHILNAYPHKLQVPQR